MTIALEPDQAVALEEVLQRVASDLSMIADRDLELGELETERMDHRPAGEGQVHISFRMAFQSGDGWSAGCLLIPFPDAVALAGCLLMLPEETLVAQREVQALDEPAKDAMLELGSFIAGAAQAALSTPGQEVQVEFEGCQGVRPDVRPAMTYSEGDPLLVVRAQASLEGFDPQTYLLMVPAGCLE